MARIVLDHVRKRYANGFVAAHDVSLDIVDGELLVLVGPSGSGKSTLLRMIAGLEPVTSGRILIGGRDVTALPPQERDLAMVFQSYALYPHMTVRQNLAFGLSVRRQPQTIIQERVSTTAESLGLSSLLDRKPGQLSGGQRQRVALGRAIVREPLAFLFDEPLSNLDARLRAETRAELARLHERLGATMVYVTHDQVEAMTLGTRVAVMNGGALQQVAPPMTLYRAPATQFVAGFIGSPAMNFVEGVVRRRDGGAVFEGSKLTLTLGERRIEDARRVVLGLRPQGLSIGGVGRVGGERGDESLDGAVGAGVGMRAGAGAGAGAVKDSGGNPGESWDARVWLVEALGNEQIVHVAAGDVRDLVVVAPVECVVRSGDVVRVRAAAGAAHLFDAATGRVID